MTARAIAMAAAGASGPDKLYVDDVFSTYLYTGTGSSQTINNGIDLAGKGGMVWIKSRANQPSYGIYPHVLVDTEVSKTYGAWGGLSTDSTNQVGYSSNGLGGPPSSGGFSSTGFYIGEAAGDPANTLNNTYTSWTFRKALKFFDVVTWTGDGTDLRMLPHSLGAAPGFVVVKAVSSSGSWFVAALNGSGTYYRSDSGSPGLGRLNNSEALGGPYDLQTYGFLTATQFCPQTVTAGNVSDGNASGVTYVAYLFAHDTATDGLVRCGSYTGNGSNAGPAINLGWEPQYLMIKNASGIGGWRIIDNMRGMPVDALGGMLYANTAEKELARNFVAPTATGFRITTTASDVNTNGSTYIYMAVRRPNKPPTTGASVLGINARAGTSANDTVTAGLPGPSDLAFIKQRNDAAYGFVWADRLRGSAYLRSASANQEATDLNAFQASAWDVMDGVKVGNGGTSSGSQTNYLTLNYINYFLRRAPGFFDQVCYRGTSSARTLNHNLGVPPELMIIKVRDGATLWSVYAAPLGATSRLRLDGTNAVGTGASDWNSTAPTASVFSLGTTSDVNSSLNNYTAYLFASCPGVSKVGSYTGNGTNQNLDCGFSAGARFLMVKRTDASGDWYVWDSARGINAAGTNDPSLSLNTTGAEQSTRDSVGLYSAGINVIQNAGTNINLSGATYIYLAIA